MKNVFTWVLALTFVFAMNQQLLASPKGSYKGSPKAMKKAAAPKHPVTAAVHKHIDRTSNNGIFKIKDKQTGKMRELKLIKVHDNVHRIRGTLFYSRAQFKDTKTKEKLELDFDVRDKYGRQNVENVFIYKVNGKERYTYGAKMKRVETK